MAVDFEACCSAVEALVLLSEMRLVTIVCPLIFVTADCGWHITQSGFASQGCKVIVFWLTDQETACYKVRIDVKILGGASPGASVLHTT